MKKLMMIAFVILFAIGSTGCKGDYSCVCTVDGEEVVSDYPEDVDKDVAEDACDAEEAAYQISDPEASCDLEKD